MEAKNEVKDTLTVTLTGRRPVQIDKAEWPIVASADDDSLSHRGIDYACYQEALARGEADRYRLKVRQHADGRTIVYGVLDAATAWTGNEDHRGGELLAPGADVAAAIRRVGEECGLPDRVIRDCVADLPAEKI